VVATSRGPGVHAANTSHSICVGVLRGPLNSRVGSAVGRAAVALAGWDAWRRACAVGLESEGRLLVR
jgi:hypothetical protein